MSRRVRGVWGGFGGSEGIGGGLRSHLMPLCTTRFLQLRQQVQAWLHSKMRGGSILLNSCSSRPSWGGHRGEGCVSLGTP